MHDDPPRVAWADFLAGLDWRQGEHVTLVGPTGLGKTTLALQLVERRRHVVAFASKPKDSTLAGLTRRGWVKQRRWSPRYGQTRILLWPIYKRMEDKRPQAATFLRALESIFVAGGWCVLVDDTNYLVSVGLGPVLEDFWYQGRSIGISVVASVQRPRHVPLLAYSQATHLFFWRTTDHEDLKRIGGLNGVNNVLVREVVQSLAKHDVLYVNTRTGAMAITRSERTP